MNIRTPLTAAVIAAVLVTAPACGKKSVSVHEAGGGTTHATGNGTTHATGNGTEHGTGHGTENGSGSGSGHAHESSDHGSPINNGSGQAPFKAEWKPSTPKPKPNETFQLQIAVNDEKGKPVDKFEISHEKVMHLIVISKDLSVFQHLHPEYKGGNRFETEMKLQVGGDYKLIADFVPNGSAQQTAMHALAVEGPPSTKPVIVDKKLVKSAAGNEVSLSFDSPPMANKETVMTFTFKDERTGKPVTDLQPYLGAVGHVVLLSADGERYVHNHPIDEKTGGPEAKFAVTFPQSGVYKIWAQFQRSDETFTVPYVVQVP